MGTSWQEGEWEVLLGNASLTAGAAATDKGAWAVVDRCARAVLRNYSTSFFLVTRFLPPRKRLQVEVIYAAVRYPDEVVDTFPIKPAQRSQRLDRWSEAYETGLVQDSLRDSIRAGVPALLAGFTQVVRRNQIPHEHYRAFLDAMRLDIEPRRFQTVDDLIDSYIYGSAIVVGYFLAYVYGPSRPDSFARALTSARRLAIALQLTNFLRDVGEDKRRRRVYLPCDLLKKEGLHGAQRRVSAIAEDYYKLAQGDLDAFAPDCQPAIQACIDVYRRLNQRIGRSQEMARRATVPTAEKFRVLPASKYWRLPLAYLGVL